MSDDRKTGSVGDLKEGKFVIIDEHPCRIVNIQKSKPGKHGHAKARVEAMSVFDGSKHSIMAPSSDKVEIPLLDKRSGQILAINGDTVQLMDLQSFETFETKLPEGVKAEAGGQMPYWIVLGRKLLTQEA